MNLRNSLIIIISVIVLAFLSGCIKDNYDDCVQGIDISFYSQTPCQSETSYPETIKDLSIFVFDENDVLESYKHINDVKLQKDFLQTIETESGMHSVLAWSGLDSEYYDIIEPQIGVTKKQALLFRLKRVAQVASAIDSSMVYFGESNSVYVPKADKTGTVYEKTSVNMQEVTNRILVSIEGLPNVEDYEVKIESDNGSMNVNGTIAGDEIIDHVAEATDVSGVLNAHFTLLKLATGYNNTIVVKNKLDGRELYRGSLLGTLLLKNPSVNLDCDHDFVIRFTTKDQCKCGTYTIMEIWVNNWLVHSYETEM